MRDVGLGGRKVFESAGGGRLLKLLERISCTFIKCEHKRLSVSLSGLCIFRLEPQLRGTADCPCI